jgi:hypothetical protein
MQVLNSKAILYKMEKFLNTLEGLCPTLILKSILHAILFKYSNRLISLIGLHGLVHK